MTATLEHRAIELTTCDLPKRLAAKLAEHDRLRTYLNDVCRRDAPPFVRLDGDTVAGLYDWCARKLGAVPDPLTFRGRQIIAGNEPPPAYRLG